MNFIPICKFCLIKVEPDAINNIVCEDTAAQMTKIISELFRDLVTVTKLELQALCKTCRFKLQEFYLYHNTVIRNQKKYYDKISEICSVSGGENSDRQNTSAPTLIDVNNFEPKIIVKTEIDYLGQESDREDYGDIMYEIDINEEQPKIEEEDDFKMRLSTKKLRNKGTSGQSNFRLKTGWIQSKEKHERDMHDFTIIESFYELACDICPDAVKFQTYRELTSHYTKAHAARKKFTCCGMKFKSRIQLVEHAQAHFNPKVCETCGAQFVREKHFKKHFLECMARFECDICHKSFNTRKTIASHMRGSHMESKKVVCEICGKTLNAGAVSNHVRRKHSNFVREMIDCHLCGKRMAKDTFKRHYKDVHERKEPLVCPHCGKEFEARKNYLRHVRNVHVVGRIHKCGYDGCDKGFHTPEALKEHIATHTGVPLYDCKYCEWSFKSAGNFYAHMRRKHPLEHAQLKEETRKKLLTNSI